MPEFIIAEHDEDYANAALLFEEYAVWLNIDLSFQQFDNELNNLRSMYAALDGGIILCKVDNEFVACAAIRKIDRETSELKRMFVKPAFQRQGIGSALLEKAICLADCTGYSRIRLDTLNHMTSAINLYKQNGFYEIPAYYHNPNSTAVYFEIKC